MRNSEDTAQKTQNAAVAAISAASKTPFQTAFKITMGIYLAHLLAGVIGLSMFVGFAYTLYRLLK